MIPVIRSQLRLLPEPRRVIAKPFLPGGDLSADGRTRVERILARVLTLSQEVAVTTLAEVCERFASRHLEFISVLERQFAAVQRHVPHHEELSVERKRLIGAYFTHEFAVDAAALTNPSLVQAPHQDGVAAGCQRFIMSLRAIGEGHVSSIQFRSGIIDELGQVTLDETSRFARTAAHRPPTYEKGIF